MIFMTASRLQNTWKWDEIMQTFLGLIEQEPMALKDLKIVLTKPDEIIKRLCNLYYLD